MNKNEEIIKSEIGTEAAWRGFSTQTLYIANWLLLAENNVALYPECVEDLMIKKREEVIELVQVKNLSNDLSLSDLRAKMRRLSGFCIQHRVVWRMIKHKI